MNTNEMNTNFLKILSNKDLLEKFYLFCTYNQRFSFFNAAQIFSSNPDVTVCLPLSDWNVIYNRRVKKGERAFSYNDENDSYIKKYVFDIKQTHGVVFKYKRDYLSDDNIIKYFNQLYVFKQTIDSSKIEQLNLCSQQYCLERGIDLDYNHVKDVIQALSFCVYSYFHGKDEKLNGLIQPLNYDEETNIRLANTVVETSQDIIQGILKRRLIEDEKHKQSNSRRSNRNGKESAASLSQSLWVDGREVFEGEQQSFISQLDFIRRDKQISKFDSGGGSNVTGNSRDSIQERQSRTGQLFGADEVRKANANNDSGYSAESSNIQQPNSLEQDLEIFSKEKIDYSGGQKTKFRNNINAIKIVKRLEETNTQASEEEKEALTKYVGWGGLSQVFDEKNKTWKNEYIELKELLNITEYEAAEGSVLNAHYTDINIIKEIYNGVLQLGFHSGKILEPAMGTGNFIGSMPISMRAPSQIYGIEIDNLPARIAQQLYPDINIQITGFEKTSFDDNFFDAVITNVPFGDYSVFDIKYNSLNFKIHDYFIAKAIDKTRPGGLLAVITTKGTLDKRNNTARQYFAARAELLGAIRLPNNAFLKNANTEATTDILFFKKREEIIDPKNEEWIYIGKNSDNVILNEYYISNPEMMLGKMVTQMSMYGRDDETTLIPDEQPLYESLHTCIENLPHDIYKASRENTKINPDEELKADYSIKNLCFTVYNEKIYQRYGDKMLQVNVSKNNIEKVKSMIELREALKDLLDKQIAGCSDRVFEEHLLKFNNLYDSFLSKYGYLNDKQNYSLFREDGDSFLLFSIEKRNKATGEYEKNDVFYKRTIYAKQQPKKTSDPYEAMQICRNMLGRVDIRYIEELTQKDYIEIINTLGNKIFKNPSKISNFEDKYQGWETAEDYLSGDVKEKLVIAMRCSLQHEEFKRNIAALREVQPSDLSAGDIKVRMGAPWIEKKYYKQFVHKLLNINKYSSYASYEDILIDYNNYTGEWNVKGAGWYRKSAESINSYGTERVDAYKLIEQTLNLQTPTVYDTVKDVEGKEKRVLNRNETIAAREKQRLIIEAFKNWIFDDVNRREDIVRTYNDKFNRIRLPEYDGRHLDFPYMSPLISLLDHQKNAVQRIILSGNTLLAHVVGAGKTYTMIAAAMKMKQYGLANKPMFVVPNNLVDQFAGDFISLYPNAQLLVATEKDFEKAQRLKFVSRIALGEWDGIIIAGTSFEKIPISEERQETKIRSEIEEIKEAVYGANKLRDNRITVKGLQKILKNKEKQLQKLLDTSKKDSLINFENLGVDCLFIDEADRYKNKFIFTKMNNVAGLSRAMSQRASDLELKIEYINELHKASKGVVFATGTPISNSMVEMYTMQTYMQKEELKKVGLHHFDFWAATFGETITALELAPSGRGYRTKTRFSKFNNLPELLIMYRSFADVQTQEMINLPVPKANHHIVSIKPSDDILILTDELAERAEAIYDKRVTPEIDNMLKITSDGKKIALDPRVFNPDIPDNDENKLHACVNNVFEIWKETEENKCTQIIFCDLSTPKTSYKDYKQGQDFDVYNELKYLLIKKGIKESDIAYVHEAKTNREKQELFNKVRAGEVRILIGSTEKCGAGTNVQDRLKALHHIDAPYRPRDLEQRNGRIIRQGNRNKEVDIYTYVTERTFDSYSYQILENKQRFISQINTGALTIREADDIDEITLTYAEVKAITAANPAIKRKMEIENELSRLCTLESQYNNNKYKLEKNVHKTIPDEISRINSYIYYLKEDIALRNKNQAQAEEFCIMVGDVNYVDRKEAGTELNKYIGKSKFYNTKVGQTYGFSIILDTPNQIFNTQSITLKGAGEYSADISLSEIGNITRIENCLKSLDDKLLKAEQTLKFHEQELIAAKEQLIHPFEHKETIHTLSSELQKINSELDLDKQEIIVTDENQEADMEDKNEIIEDMNIDELEESLSFYKIQTKEPYIKINPLRVYDIKNDQVLIKIESAEGLKNPVWLLKEQVQLKDNFVIEAAQSIVQTHNFQELEIPVKKLKM